MLRGYERMSEINPLKIKRVELLDYQRKLADKIYNVINWLFTEPSLQFPFKGFLLYGPPGTGKSEIIKQVSRRIFESVSNVKILYIDGSDIASPRWGDAETKLKEVFTLSEFEKKIILFDDIESLMMSRGTNIAKEWHYSINSVLFHELDFLDSSKAVVLATTNRIDLVDEALKSRFYLIEVPGVPKEELLRLSNKFISNLSLDGGIKETIKNEINNAIKNNKLCDLRQVIQEITVRVFNYIAEVKADE